MEAGGPARIAVPKEERRRAGFDPAESAGFFVGVSRFADPLFAEVAFAVDDAVDLAHLFTFELQLVTATKVVIGLAGDPRKPDSQRRLQELLDAGARTAPARLTDLYGGLDAQRRAAGPKGLFVAAFATHGFSDQGGDFLVAADSLRRRIALTGVAVGALFDDVARSPAPRRLVLLDACRERLSSATRGSDPSAAMSAGFADAIARASGQAVLAGATLGGFAYDDPARRNGVFTASILEGLRGSAPADERGYVTVSTLADYVQERVAAWVRDHCPDHAGRSRGIARRLEGAAAGMPLAVDAARRRTEDARRQRLEAARARLRENIGETIPGALFDDIAAVLSAEPPAADLDALLAEIEALDGAVRSQRSLAYFWQLRQAPSAESHADPMTGSKARSVELETPDDDGHHPRARILVVLAALTILVFGIRWWPTFSGGSPEPTDVIRAGTETAPPVAEPDTAAEDAGEADEPADDLVSEPVAPPPPDLSTEDRKVSIFDEFFGRSGNETLSEVGPLGMEFRYIPSGTFTMGSPKDEPGHEDNEKQHQVTLTRAFWMSETEVTQGQWQALMDNNPSRFKRCGKDCPVENVSWFEAVEFANRLSKNDSLKACYVLEDCQGTAGGCAAGKWGCSGDYSCKTAMMPSLDCEGYRLPTEAEWEYATRAETETPFWTGANLTTDQANYDGNYPYGDHPEGKYRQKMVEVRSFEPNPWGLYEVHGNVGEWTWDWYASYDGAATDPSGPDGGSYRVVRGGGWNDDARYCRSADRYSYAPGDRSAYVGFRLVRTHP